MTTDNVVTPGYSYQSQIDQEFAQINQQISDLTLQYESNQYPQQPESLTVHANDNYYDHSAAQNQYMHEQQYERPVEEVPANVNYYGSYQPMSLTDNGNNFNAEVNK